MSQLQRYDEYFKIGDSDKERRHGFDLHKWISREVNGHENIDLAIEVAFHCAASMIYFMLE